jgi:hypothetical protein
LEIMKRKIISVLMSLALVCGTFAGFTVFAFADGTYTMENPEGNGMCGDNITYTYDAATQTLELSGNGVLERAFSDSDNVRTVVIHPGITSIYGDPTYGAPLGNLHNLVNVGIPNTVTYIGREAFSNSVKTLKSIRIPDSVTAMGDYPFPTSLTDIYYSGTQEQWNSIDLLNDYRGPEYYFEENEPPTEYSLNPITVHYGASVFDDVLNANDFYYTPVYWAADSGITKGTSKILFSPDLECTRAQIVTFLWRANGSPDVAVSNEFTDVSSDQYYAKAVAWAVQQGITVGTSDTTFSPDMPCTRAQAVTFLWRANESPSASASSKFNDVDSSQYYADAVNWAVKNNITAGTSDAIFSPDVVCTRAQIVTFIYRAK